MPQLIFSEEQKKQIREIVYDILYKDYSPKVTETFAGIERNLSQKSENIEATQKIAIENQKGIKDLIKLNYDLILRNNNAIKNNYDEIRKNYSEIKSNYDGIKKNNIEIKENNSLIREISKKLDRILQKIQ